MPMLFGVRVRLGAIGGSALALDYCGGADPEVYGELLRLVVSAMLSVPESAAYSDIRDIFPFPQVKPVNLDAAFWSDLGMLSANALAGNAGKPALV